MNGERRRTAATANLNHLHESLEALVDPVGIIAPLAHAQLAWLTHPQELAEMGSRASADLLAVMAHSWRRAVGLPSEDPVLPHADDKRFLDPAWREEPSFDIVKEWYLLITRHVQDALYETPGLSGRERRRAAFWWREWLNAMAPTNFLWLNPEAMRKAAETRGESLARGLQNFLADLQAGTVRMTDPEDFRVGENLATTPGAVVYRNDLLEVIHYAATTPRVHALPIVIVTPWINKFYVLDLTPRKSLVKFLLDQGFQVFITSWRNPGPEMRDTGFEHYLMGGVERIVEVARAVSGAGRVHAVGYCIGGTALAMYMAWANRRYGEAEKVPVAHWSLFTTLVDFHKPGDIDVFLDEGTVRWLSRTMASRGYLDGREMAAAFRLLRSNSLIWHYVVHGYLYGETPPTFDVLYWNMDTTRMPARMHEWYLRELYLNNRLIRKDQIEIAGEALDLERIRQPLYAVCAEDDHIAPWAQAFRICNFVMAPKRFVLASSGHILGIVNPVVVPPKRSYRVGIAHRADSAEGWRERAEGHEGTWWTDWVEWLRPQCGELVEPPPLATPGYPKLADAPGAYVLER
ncbi:MAG: alpha/beta hydrolase [Betaproteobacteria bacterium CG2_30_68_42]|nr:MAG: alpha/beta hydrolase [Betaproteobacteria bacterium CG2_30_68_42]PJA58219.1 MAG: alpha/beta hydrolase [Rhodocyclales bacterium CG_4_9_14_3_um_filter_68_10]